MGLEMRETWYVHAFIREGGGILHVGASPDPLKAANMNGQRLKFCWPVGRRTRAQAIARSLNSLPDPFKWHHLGSYLAFTTYVESKIAR